MARPHTPLAVMLVLTQLSVGAFLTNVALGVGGTFEALVAVATGAVALGASVLHLGRPRYAYRAVIGLRHSWLSREVVAFGAFTGLATLAALSSSPPLEWAAAACGVAGVVCSVLIYTTTRRWSVAAVIARFGFTTALGGLLVVASAALAPSLASAALMTAAIGAVIAGSIQERRQFFTSAGPPR
jgi:DMSO reductase anchor subunit